MTKLVIVESPTKAKTISRFLPRDFQVEATYGHIRDLPPYKLAVDVENDFEPQYVTPRKSSARIKELKATCAKADKLILATDEDREGEAIAWHVIKALGLDSKSQSANSKSSSDKRFAIRDSRIQRIVFHEITKKAIEEALKHPRDLDQNLIDAQQARRVLDRLVGYKLSPFLWKKIMRGLSAGRVQSVALRLIVDREKEIRAFKPETFWNIEATLQKQDCKHEAPNQSKHGTGQAQKECKKFKATLSKIDDKQIEKPGIKEQAIAQQALKDLKQSSFQIKSVDRKETKRNPRPPFITSTLQQEAWARLKFSAKKTMLIAQQLYEGINISKEGPTGLITYMRTDSVNLSSASLQEAKKFIEKEWGKNYAINTTRKFKSSKRAQEAHEAIRPTNTFLTPDSVRNDLSRDQYRLYDLIWRRFVATQMKEAIFDNTALSISARNGNKNYELKATGSIVKFEGFLKVYEMKITENILPSLAEKTGLRAEQVESVEGQTQPPPRYSEATLIKTLEKFDIGRPSTYAPIMSTIQSRGYVNKNESKHLVPTEIGEKVNEVLTEHFPKIVEVEFTAKMEEELDEVAEGKKEWRRVIKDFYGPFEKNLQEKYESVEKQDITEKTDANCPECGKPLVIRHGRYGKFIACSGFPDCQFTKNLPTEPLHIKCPKCKEGDVVERRTKRRRLFYGCSRYPECDFGTWQKPTGELCIECSSPIVELKSGARHAAGGRGSPKAAKCSNKNCKFRQGKPSKKTA